MSPCLLSTMPRFLRLIRLSRLFFYDMIGAFADACLSFEDDREHDAAGEP